MTDIAVTTPSGVEQTDILTLMKETPVAKDESTKTQESRGVGLDCGTMNLVSARRTPKGIETRRMRDAFLDLPSESKKMLLYLVI